MSALADDNARQARDRSALAARLDEAQAARTRLADANEEVAGRLIGVMEQLRRMGASGEGGG